MHTKNFENGIFFYHGDYQGDVTIRVQDPKSGKSTEIEVPFSALEELISEKYRLEKIGKLEDASAQDILMGKV